MNLCTNAVAAPAIQPLADISAAVRTLLLEQREADSHFRIGRLDPRLRLPRCDAALAARFTRERASGTARSVEVRCEGAKPWNLYVPVTITRYDSVIVATRPLARGTLITAADVSVERREVGAASGSYLSDTARAVGMRVARRLQAGQVLTAAAVERPRVVRRGDQVTLSSQTRGIEVRVRGEALEDGARGETINVLNLRSERVIQGTVMQAGEVRVNGSRLL